MVAGISNEFDHYFNGSDPRPQLFALSVHSLASHPGDLRITDSLRKAIEDFLKLAWRNEARDVAAINSALDLKRHRPEDKRLAGRVMKLAGA